MLGFASVLCINPVERSRGIWSRRKGAEKDLSGMNEVTKLATAGLSLEDVFGDDVGSKARRISDGLVTGFREEGAVQEDVICGVGLERVWDER